MNKFEGPAVILEYSTQMLATLHELAEIYTAVVVLPYSVHSASFTDTYFGMYHLIFGTEVVDSSSEDPMCVTLQCVSCNNPASNLRVRGNKNVDSSMYHLIFRVIPSQSVGVSRIIHNVSLE